MSQETFPVGNGKQEDPPYEEGGFEPLRPTPQTEEVQADSPSNLRFFAGDVVEFISPETGKVMEGRIIGFPAAREGEKEGKRMVHINVNGEPTEVLLRGVQEYMFEKMVQHEGTDLSQEKSKERAN